MKVNYIYKIYTDIEDAGRLADWHEQKATNAADAREIAKKMHALYGFPVVIERQPRTVYNLKNQTHAWDVFARIEN